MSTCPHARTLPSVVSSCVGAAQDALMRRWGQACALPTCATRPTAAANVLPLHTPISACCSPTCVTVDVPQAPCTVPGGRWELGRHAWLCGYLIADASGLRLCDVTTSMACIATSAGMQHLHSIVCTREWTLVMDGSRGGDAPEPVLILGRLHVLLSATDVMSRLALPSYFACDTSAPCAAAAVCVSGTLVTCYALTDAASAALCATQRAFTTALLPPQPSLSHTRAHAVADSAAGSAHAQPGGWLIELNDAVWRGAPAASRALLWYPHTDLTYAARWLASPGQAYCFPHCYAHTAVVDGDCTPLFLLSPAVPERLDAHDAAHDARHVPAWNDVWRVCSRFGAPTHSAFDGCAHAACTAPALPPRVCAAMRAALSQRACEPLLHFEGEVTAATDTMLHVQSTDAAVRVWLLDHADLAWHVRVLRAAGVMPARLAAYCCQPALQLHTPAHAASLPLSFAQPVGADGMPRMLVAALPSSHIRLYGVQAARSGGAPPASPALHPHSAAATQRRVLSHLTSMRGGVRVHVWALLVWCKMCEAARSADALIDSWRCALDAHSPTSGVSAGVQPCDAHIGDVLPWPITLRDVHSTVARIVAAVRAHVVEFLSSAALNPFLHTLIECPALRAQRCDDAERAISRTVAARFGWHARVRWSRHMCSLTLQPAPHWLLVHTADKTATPPACAQSMRYLHVDVLLCTPAAVVSSLAPQSLPLAAIQPPSGCVCATPPPPSCPCALLHWSGSVRDIHASASAWSSVTHELPESDDWLALRTARGAMETVTDTMYRIRMESAHAAPACSHPSSTVAPVLPLPVCSINAVLAPESTVLLSSLAAAQSLMRHRERSGAGAAPTSDAMKAALAAGQECAPCVLVGRLMSWEWANASATSVKLLLTLEHESLPWCAPAARCAQLACDTPARGRITVVVRGSVQQLMRAVGGVRAGEALALGPALFNRINGAGRTVTAACNLSHARILPCPHTWSEVQAMWPHSVCVVDEARLRGIAPVRTLRDAHQSSWPTTQSLLLRHTALTAISWLDIAWIHAHTGAKLPVMASTLPLQHLLATGMAHCWGARTDGTCAHEEAACIRTAMRGVVLDAPDVPRCACGAPCAADLPSCTDCLCVRMQATVVIDDGTGEARCHLTDTWTVYDICLATLTLYDASGIALSHGALKSGVSTPVRHCPRQSEHMCGASLARRASASLLGWDGAQIGFWALIAAALGGAVSASPNAHAAASAPLVAEWIDSCAPRTGEKRDAQASRPLYELHLTAPVRRGCASFIHVLRERATPLRVARAALALHAVAIEVPTDASAHLLASVAASQQGMRHDGSVSVPLGARRWAMDVRQFQVASSKVMSTLSAAQASRSAPPPCASSAARTWLRHVLENRGMLLGAACVPAAMWESLQCIAALADSPQSDALTLVQRTNLPLGFTSCMMSSFSLDVLHVQLNTVVLMDDTGRDDTELNARLAALELLASSVPPPAIARFGSL